MAALRLAVNSAEVVLVAATAKTALQIKAPTNQRLKITQISVLGKSAAGGTDTPLKIRLTRSTANFGTGTAATPGKVDPAWAETVQSTAAGNFSAEPTSPTDSGTWFEVQPQVGIILPFPPGTEILIPGGNALNIEATSTATPTILVTVWYEE